VVQVGADNKAAFLAAQAKDEPVFVLPFYIFLEIKKSFKNNILKFDVI
jgi:hypothetical protein